MLAANKMREFLNHGWFPPEMCLKRIVGSAFYAL